MPRAFDISLEDGVELAAIKLKKSNALIGAALNVLTEDEADRESLKTLLGILTRVLNEVNWSTVSKDKPEAWLLFYEYFLEVYHNRLRKLTGSYYTPPEVVTAMTDLVDQTLRRPLFKRSAGLASSDEQPDMTRQGQLNLFGEQEPELPGVESAPAVYRADPNEVRAELQRVLAKVRAAQSFPWGPRRTLYWRTVFPQMTNWLPDDEAAQLRFEFETEIRRLEAA
jgi:N-6 DNA Methylase